MGGRRSAGDLDIVRGYLEEASGMFAAVVTNSVLGVGAPGAGKVVLVTLPFPVLTSVPASAAGALRVDGHEIQVRCREL
jgi:hypothetical protein